MKKAYFLGKGTMVEKRPIAEFPFSRFLIFPGKKQPQGHQKFFSKKFFFFFPFCSLGRFVREIDAFLFWH